MDSGMLIMTAVLGVAAVGIAAMTMDSTDPRAPRNNFKARFAEEYDSKVTGMSEVDQVKWARAQDERRKQLLIRRQSMGTKFAAADFKRNEVIQDMAAQVKASRGTKPEGERYTTAEDRVLRDRLDVAMNANAAYGEPAIREAVLQSQISKINHRLAHAEDLNLDPTERRAQMELAKKWQRDYGVTHAGLTEADKALTEEERQAKAAADRADFLAALAAIPDDPAEANFDELEAIKAAKPPGYDDDELDKKYKSLLELAYAAVVTQLAKPDATADDDIANEMYRDFKKREKGFFGKGMKPDLTDPKLNLLERTAILDDVNTSFGTEKNVATRSAFIDTLGRSLHRRPSVLADIKALPTYLPYVRQTVIMKSITSLFAAYPTLPHMQIITVCTADYMKAVHDLADKTKFEFGVDIDGKEAAAVALIQNEVAGLARVADLNKFRMLMLRTRGRLIDLNAAKAAVLPALRATWQRVLRVYDERAPARSELLSQAFLEFRKLLTQYWGTPTNVEFERYSDVSMATKNMLAVKIEALADAVDTRADIMAKLSVITSEYLAEGPDIIDDVNDYFSVIKTAWISNCSSGEGENFMKNVLFPHLPNVEEDIITIEARKVLFARGLYAEWLLQATDALRIDFVVNKQITSVVEYPEVYFPEYAVAVYPPASQTLVSELKAAIAAGQGQTALDRREAISRLSPALKSAAEEKATCISIRDADRLLHLKSLIEATLAPPLDPAAFIDERKIELSSLYQMRKADWGLMIVDNYFGLIPDGPAFMAGPSRKLGAMVVACNTEVANAVAAGVAADDVLDIKKAFVTKVLNKKRTLQIPVAPRATPGAQTFDDIVNDVTPSLKAEWLLIQHASDDARPGQFTEREELFNTFLLITTPYFPNADVVFPASPALPACPAFSGLLNQTRTKSDALIAQKGDDILAVTDILENAPPGAHSSVVIDSLKTQYDPALPPHELIENQDVMKLIDVGRYFDSFGDWDKRRYDEIRSLLVDRAVAGADLVEIRRKADLLMEYAEDLFP